MMSKKETVKFILLLTIATVIIAITILLFCWVCYLVPIDFPGTVGEWITAFSALAGGALTLGGVWWTIKDSEKRSLEQKLDFIEQQKITDSQRRKDLAMQYRPILNCEVTNHILLNNNVALCTYFSLKNIGRAEAIDVKIKTSSELPIFSQITYDHTSTIEKNNIFQFIITFVWKGRDLGDGTFESLQLDKMYDLTKKSLNSSVEITFSDIVDTKYCLHFNVECHYIVNLNGSNTNGLNLDQIQKLVDSTPKTWRIDLKNVETIDISNGSI